MQNLDKVAARILNLPLRSSLEELSASAVLVFSCTSNHFSEFRKKISFAYNL
jgi:hypothetical protein